MIAWTLLIAAVAGGACLPRFGVAIADLANRHMIEDARDVLGLDPGDVAGHEVGAPHEVTLDRVRGESWGLAQTVSWVAISLMAALLLVGAAPPHAGWVWLAGAILVLFVLLTLSGSDAARRMIPDAVMMPAIVAAVMYNAWFHSEPWMTYRISLAACVGTYALMEVMSIIGGLFGEPAGGGDSKLMAFVAAWVGFLPAMLMIGLAIAIALVHVKLRRALYRSGRQSGLSARPPQASGFPVAPYLFVSFFVIHYMLTVGGAHAAIFQ
jgi:prepilin signal peptidase PulO-like enzyme (type II secretory pathway)